ncbi:MULTISPECIES: amidohydrolase [unclassified Pseudomonas]|uniref:amidohydrolase n=1 Tax=unclassified Pseudomonas TaxID=196821 RepID=UPI00129E973B|nr:MULTISPECIES: amidohydrolase [unclassified Pseudomonas]MDH4656470.1 amidohydrolase [Pseudomonas sp. BN606]MRK20168.1 amidohydrolase [Pseudomonas sp. JG-B]
MKTFAPKLLAVALACSSMESFAAVDLILHNAKVYTAEPGQALQQAVAVEDGKVRAVGSNAEILRLKESGTQVMDLGGKVLMPGFIDSHSHAIFGGLELDSASMGGQLIPVEELEQRLRQWRDNGKARHGDALSVSGLPSAAWGQVAELEQRFNRGEWADVPIFFLGWDHHTGWANQAMLKRAGIDAAKVKGLKGEAQATIGHHPDGRPNGFLADAGLDPVMAQLPPASAEQLLKAARSALRYNLSLGITAWMDPAANAAPGEPLFDFKPTAQTLGVLPAYKALAEKGELTAHVAALLVANPKSKPADLDTLDQVRQRFQGVPNLTLPGIKVFADGVAEVPAQTAAMLDPYKNSNKRGELLIDPAHFGDLVSAADARGWLVHVHAIGDRAVRESLNGIEQARKDRQSGIAHSVTHLQMVNPKEFARFKPLDVIASMQLYWASADEVSIDLVQPYISAMAFQFQYPARSLLKNGATISGASDWPVTTPEPWKAIYQAVSRKGPKGVLNAAEEIDRETMFQAYTLNSARTIGLEKQIGSLSPGKQADLILLDRDVFQVEPEALQGTQVLKTWFAGREVFNAAL